MPELALIGTDVFEVFVEEKLPAQGRATQPADEFLGIADDVIQIDVGLDDRLLTAELEQLLSKARGLVAGFADFFERVDVGVFSCAHNGPFGLCASE